MDARDRYPRFGRYTTIVIGSDGQHYDLGKGEHLPPPESEVLAVNAFTQWIGEAQDDGRTR
jgi:hypothetical protein